MNDSNSADLLTAATNAIDSLRKREADVSRQIDTLQVELEVVREVLGQLTGRPRARRRKPVLDTPLAPDVAPELEPAA